ncbi:MAG: hypothetical protein KKH28_02775, partial [Elusimicrobia bacterium]|nr:hypothetical protein [Elusimicrobiota bacterium]
SKMFDGTGDFAAKDFNVNSNQSPVLTGKGGSVGDLKASDPNIKTSPISEFSLENKPTTLLASAKTTISPQKAEAATASCEPYKFAGANVCETGNKYDKDQL